jgi:AcrR family transcriptional regulator
VTRISSVERRLALIDAALRVIAAHGVAGATTRAIVAEAKMSLSSFHYVFSSRDAMLRELIRHVVSNQTIAARESLRFSGDLRSAIRDALRAFYGLVNQDHRHEQVMFELMQYSLRTPTLSYLPAEQYDRYRSSVSVLLDTAAAETHMEWLLPVDDIARIVVTFTDGITLAWLADRDSEAGCRVIEFAATSIAALAQPLDAEHRVAPLRNDSTPTLASGGKR